jgi:hypothetical protein
MLGNEAVERIWQILASEQEGFEPGIIRRNPKRGGGVPCYHRYKIDILRGKIMEGPIFLETRHYTGSKGFVVHVTEKLDGPRKTETFETEEEFLTYLRKFNLERWTPEQVLEQLLLPPAPDTPGTKFQVVARKLKVKGAF